MVAIMQILCIPAVAVLYFERNDFMITDYNDYLTPYEAAYELGISLTTIYNLLRNKKLPGFKVGKIWRIPRDALEKLIYG